MWDKVNLTLVLNIVVIAMLVITIAYCYILNRKIKNFQAQSFELQHLTDRFVDATNTAQQATQALKQQGSTLTADLNKAVNKGERLYADIDFLLCRAEKAALSMENKPAASKSPPPTAQQIPVDETVNSRSKAEQELLQAIADAKNKAAPKSAAS